MYNLNNILKYLLTSSDMALLAHFGSIHLKLLQALLEFITVSSLYPETIEGWPTCFHLLDLRGPTDRP